MVVLRLFVSVALTDRAAKRVSDCADALRKFGVTGSFVPRENYHITLSFIGEAHDAEAPIKAMSGVEAEPFRITFGRYGCFGNVEYIAPVNAKEMIGLMNRVRRALAENGVKTDDSYPVPHVTLIRRSRRPYGFDYPTPEPFSMSINAIALMRSAPGEKHSVYETVFRKSFI